MSSLRGLWIYRILANDSNDELAVDHKIDHEIDHETDHRFRIVPIESR